MGSQRPEEHETEDQAERLFQSKLPASWVAEPYRKGYGVDYRVEEFEGGEKTGLSLDAQLKGTNRALHIFKGSVRFPIEVRHLSDNLDKERQPIYLVVVDVINQRGYWLFLQRYAVEKLKGKRWRKQKTITIEIPIGNELSDFQRLADDVRAADAYMCSMRPGALPVSYSIERERLTTIDPRFEFQLAGIGNSLGWSLSPKEPVELLLNVNVSEDETAHKLKEYVDGGQSVEFAPHEFSIEGSPLFDNQTAKLQLTKIERSIEISVEMYRTSNDKKTFIGQSAGILTGNELRASVNLPFEGSPVEWNFVFDLDKANREATTKSSVAFDFARWENRPVHPLPHFPQVFAITKAVHDGDDILLRFMALGNELLSASIPSKEISLLGELAAPLRHIENLQAIAQATGVELTVPKEFLASEERDASELRLLLERKSIERKAANAGMQFNVPRSEAEPLLKTLKESKQISLKLEGPREYNIAGYSFCFWPCSMIESAMTMEDVESFETQLSNLTDTQTIQVSLVAAMDNVLTIDISTAELSCRRATSESARK